MKGFMRKAFTYISMFAILVICAGCQKDKKIEKLDETQAMKSNLEEKEEQTDDSSDESLESDAISQEDIDEEPKKLVLTIGCDELSNSYLPVQSFSQNDVVLNQINLPLVTMARGGEPVLRGKDGQTISYQNKDYYYEGLCNIDITYKKEKDLTTYKIDLRDDVYFSDGVKLNADDLIFSLYLFCDPNLGNQFNQMKIVGLSDYVQDSPLIEEITGIQKISDTEVTITTYGYDPSFIYELSIPVYPLHYYGDLSMYDYEKHQFGFRKGNYQLDDAKRMHPLGAGPFQYEGFDEESRTLVKNEKYFQGVPKIDFVRFVTVPEEERVYEMKKQTIDLTQIIGSKQRYSEIERINHSKDLVQGFIGMKKIGDSGIGYIGMNVERIKIGEDAFSYESIALRKAIGTIIAIYREESFMEFAGSEMDVIDDLASKEVWYAQRNPLSDPCYSENFMGNSIYSKEMTYQERYRSAMRAAKDYFVQAGYVYDAVKRKLIAPPEGGTMHFTITVNDLESHPANGLLVKAQEAFQKIGIDFEIYNETEDDLYWDIFEGGLTDLWCGGWEVTHEPELFFMYENRGLNETLMNQFEEISNTISYDMRKWKYKEAFNAILDNAVDIPLYQRNNAILYNRNKLNTAGITSDYTLFWNWEQDLYQLEIFDQ